MTVHLTFKNMHCSGAGTEQGFFYMHHPTDRIAHTMAFVEH